VEGAELPLPHGEQKEVEELQKYKWDRMTASTIEIVGGKCNGRDGHKTSTKPDEEPSTENLLYFRGINKCRAKVERRLTSYTP
jgi:hypothetical protein